MLEFFAKDWKGEPFILFGSAHLTALGLIALLNIVLIIWGRKASEAARRRIRVSMAVILIVNEIAWHLWNVFTGQWTIQTMLPLHLCSVLVFVSAYFLLTRSQGIYPYVYFMGIAGALQALLTPDAGIYGFPHFRAFQTMISHGLIITTGIYMTVVEGFRPTWRIAWKVFVGCNIYLLVIFVLNQIIGSNYLFVARKPETASLLDMLPAWPWYILYIELIGVICILLLYLPFAIRDWRARSQAR